MPFAEEYRRRALEAEGLSAQLGPRRGRRWLVLAQSWRELADALEHEDIESVHDRLSSRPIDRQPAGG